MGIKDFIVFRVGKVIDFLNKCWDNYQWHSIERKTHQKFKFIGQGNGGLTIEHCEGFKIDSTSQLKANTFINAWGGVTIGKYFHTGRGLTIWTSNHKYNGGDFIPYGMESDLKPVVIEDFVWTGSNVTILPGVTIGEGAVIGAGSVVTKDIPKYAVAAGNPCKMIKYRDIEQFENLKKQQKFL